MAVKGSQSAGRMLTVFENVARLQPIGVSALARALDADKSAVQRDLMTLAAAGWIRQLPGAKGVWELSPHILSLARPPHSSDSLRVRVRPALEQLRSQTQETVYLAVPFERRFIVVDALESPHMLRVVPPLGMPIPVEGSATARAILAYLPTARQAELLGGPPGTAMLAEFATIREQGFAINDGYIMPGSVTMASAIVASSGPPSGALVVTGPADRLERSRWPDIGRAVRDAARFASRT